MEIHASLSAAVKSPICVLEFSAALPVPLRPPKILTSMARRHRGDDCSQVHKFMPTVRKHFSNGSTRGGSGLSENFWSASPLNQRSVGISAQSFPSAAPRGACGDGVRDFSTGGAGFLLAGGDPPPPAGLGGRRLPEPGAIRVGGRGARVLPGRVLAESAPASFPAPRERAAGGEGCR